MQRDRLFHPHPVTLSSAVQRGAAASHAGQGAAGGAGGVGCLLYTSDAADDYLTV